MLGGIDLSVQAAASFASMVVAELLPRVGYFAFPITVLVGFLIGLASGFVHVKLRISSFIATLAIGGVMAGLSLLMEDGHTVAILETGREQCRWISDAWLFNIPNVAFIAFVVAIAGMLVQRYTRFGRYSVAIGAGEPAARAAGIAVDRYKIMAFGFSGALAAFGGVALAARLSSGSPDLANQLLLPTIAAVIVGGTAITGGVGSIGRTVVGAVIVSIVQDRYDVCRHRHFRSTDRIRGGAGVCGLRHDRSKQDSYHQVARRGRETRAKHRPIARSCCADGQDGIDGFALAGPAAIACAGAFRQVNLNNPCIILRRKSGSWPPVGVVRETKSNTWPSFIP